MIQIAEPITLEKLLPLIKQLKRPDDMAGRMGKYRRTVPRCLCQHARG